MNKDDQKLFFEIYQSRWTQKILVKCGQELMEHISEMDEEFYMEGTWIPSDAKKELENPTVKYDYPEDLKFFSLGIRNISISDFKVELDRQLRFYAIHKKSGVVFANYSIAKLWEEIDEEGRSQTPVKKSSNDYLILEIDYPKVFIENLTNGKIDEILTYKVQNPQVWVTTEDCDLFKILETTDVNMWIDLLTDESKFFIYNINKESLMYNQFLPYSTINEVNQYFNSLRLVDEEDDVDETFDRSDFVLLTIKNPSYNRQELIKGNCEVLKQIKIIK